MLRNTALIALIATVAASNLRERSFYEEKFYNWLAEHKIAARNGEHFVHMLKNFIANDQLIEEINSKNLPYKLGHNRFSHLNREEWTQHLNHGLLTRPTGSSAEGVHSYDGRVLASEIDWVSKGAVTPVKDQGSCGSCWSFSTTGALEGAYYIKNGKLISFSEQEFVDCDTFKNGGTDMGCKGGLMDSAFNWLKNYDNGRLATEEAYPYVSGKTKERGECVSNTLADGTQLIHTGITGYMDVETNSDAALESALNIGPVSVAIQADQASFQLYREGVFTGTCGAKLDHGVLAVGYGVDAESGLPYYKVKNSWGPNWGDNGYIKLVKGDSINKTQKEGQCGILSGPPSYPILG